MARRLRLRLSARGLRDEAATHRKSSATRSYPENREQDPDDVPDLLESHWRPAGIEKLPPSIKQAVKHNKPTDIPWFEVLKWVPNSVCKISKYYLYSLL